ncbi:Eco57I restriction-modification methylase domain-containing protein, partial [Treponema socranskii]|uniref:Eco57I restriction-modification methylase domain-containing protein n=1 Tax=Treponema socranskii TaxID=53419 RepID=UPI0028EA54FF
RAFADDTSERFNKQFGVKNYYRDNCKKTFFKKTNKEIIDYFKSVPFLNGGLFECLDTLKDDENKQKNIEVFRDGFSREPDWMAFIPNHLFWQEDDGEHEGLIHILNRYNFTVEENTPSDVQIALDPELLGKVFENLLGTYNPETSETARKDSGSFYTPREIVDFMVDESLKTYLLQNVQGFTDKQAEMLFNDAVDLYTENNNKEIVNAIKTVKILDPACGSGAFPMGMLHKMIQIVKKCGGVKDDEKLIYQLKLALIENCLYGVDIQPIAVQICKLRFFISLICEEKQNKSVKENYGISHLPNLETKFVAANTLIGLKKEETMMLDIVNEPLSQRKKELSSIRAEHFKASTAKEKYECRKRDREKRQEIIDILERQVLTTNPILIETLENDIKNIESKLNELPVVMIDGQAEQTLFESEPKTLSKKDKNETERKRLQKQLKDKRKELESAKSKKSLDEHTAQYLRELAEWDPYDQNAVSTFFNPEWMFNVKDGFNIVIGNPPYISTKGIPSEAKKMYESEFGFSDDTYNLFTFKGLELTKEYGSLNYIIPKTFWTTQTKRKMRDLILSKNISYIFDTANPFYDVMVDTCIIQIENTKFNGSNKIKFLDGNKTGDLTKRLRYEVSQSVFLETQNSVIFKPTDYNMKIHNLYGKKVKELYEQWWDKIETSKKISENAAELKKYRESLKPGDIALLGCLTEGGVGLQTGNNGMYIAVRKKTKWAKNILISRPKKLMKAMKEKPELAKELGNINAKEYLATLSEGEIAEKFDSIKEKYGRDIFGQGYIYKLIDDDEIADVDKLTDDEKENGIDPKKKFYVPYDKGDKDGNRWYLETPFAIAWSKENVRFLKTDPRARYQGYTFFFKEGFCWSDINTTLLKCRIKMKTINDVKSMSLYSLSNKVPTFYFVCLINSNFISLYVDTFINNTQTFQVNDARQLPIIVPEKSVLDKFESIFNNTIQMKKNLSSFKIDLEKMQLEIDNLVNELYNI